MVGLSQKLSSKSEKNKLNLKKNVSRKLNTPGK
jgi:hypothetical protein